MKVDDTVLAINDTVRAKFGELAKARYVVLGSVNRLGGINVNARLVTRRPGSSSQTARVAAATPEDLTNRLPALGRMLQMTDAEKRAYEAQLAEKARPVEPPPANAELPPPPPPPTEAAAAPPPAPIVTSTPRPPASGEVAVADYGNFRSSSWRAAPPPPVVIVEAPQPVQQRACFVAVELGDNCFRRRRLPGRPATLRVRPHAEPRQPRPAVAARPVPAAVPAAGRGGRRHPPADRRAAVRRVPRPVPGPVEHRPGPGHVDGRRFLAVPVEPVRRGRPGRGLLVDGPARADHAGRADQPVRPACAWAGRSGPGTS